MYTYHHHLENLSYQTHAKLWALKSSCKGTFWTKPLSKTIVAYGVLRVNFTGIMYHMWGAYCFQFSTSIICVKVAVPLNDSILWPNDLFFFHECSIKYFVVFFFINFAVYSNGWYHMNVLLVLDWINVLHSI